MPEPTALTERARIAAFLDQRSAKVKRHGGRASARQLAIAADDIRAGLHCEEASGN